MCQKKCSIDTKLKIDLSSLYNSALRTTTWLKGRGTYLYPRAHIFTIIVGFDKIFGPADLKGLIF